MRRLYYCAAGKATKRETTWEIREEKPTFWRAYKGQKVTARLFCENVYWYFCTLGKYRVWVVYDGETVAHASYVVPKCWKFPFLKKGEFEIGPCRTAPEYRGQGIYPAVLARVVGSDADASTRANGYYMIVKDSNAPSIRGVAKAGFALLPGEIKRDFLKRRAYVENEN